MYAHGHPPERRRTDIETSSNNRCFFHFIFTSPRFTNPPLTSTVQSMKYSMPKNRAAEGDKGRTCS